MTALRLFVFLYVTLLLALAAGYLMNSSAWWAGPALVAAVIGWALTVYGAWQL